MECLAFGTWAQHWCTNKLFSEIDIKYFNEELFLQSLFVADQLLLSGVCNHPFVRVQSKENRFLELSFETRRADKSAFSF